MPSHLTIASLSPIMILREENPMPELDEVRPAGGLGELIRRVVKENQIELLRDPESEAAVALVPLDRLQQLLEESGPGLMMLLERIRELRAQERERDRRVEALARKLAAREPEQLARRELPWEAVKADPQWQQQWDELLAALRSGVPPDLTPEAIEAEIEAAREAVHERSRARRP